MFNRNGFPPGADQPHSTVLLTYCASLPENAFVAADAAALQASFSQIPASAGATPLRLRR